MFTETKSGKINDILEILIYINVAKNLDAKRNSHGKDNNWVKVTYHRTPLQTPLDFKHCVAPFCYGQSLSNHLISSKIK